MRETFPEFCMSTDGLPSSVNTDNNNSREPMEVIIEDNSLNHNSCPLNSAKFSDEEDECANAEKNKTNSESNNNIRNAKNSVIVAKDNNISPSMLSKKDLMTQIENFNNPEMRNCFSILHEEK